MVEHPLVLFVVFPLAAYVIGSTPFGVLIARAKGKDLRAAGSGNVGATNVARVVGRRWGYLCFVLDVGKGLAASLTAVLLTRPAGGDPEALTQLAWLGVGVGVIGGHVFSVYLRFRGGKGVATALGFVLGTYPYLTWPGLCAFGLWLVVVGLSRTVSLGSVTAAAAFPFLLAAFNRPLTRYLPLAALAVSMATLIIVRHRSNLARLRAGTEHKIGQGKGAAATGRPGPPEGRPEAPAEPDRQA